MKNYQKELDKIISQINPEERKPTLLLHACCGPCSSYVMEYLSSIFDITIFYYNPNIYPQEEYQRRLNELKNFLPRFPIALKNGVKLIESNYNPDDFYSALDLKNHPEFAKEAEKGERCRLCYKMRMQKAWQYAVENKFEWFTTTLSISPFKDSEKINVIGNDLQEAAFKNGQIFTKFLTSDFKKKGGFKRSLELSSEFGLYRQQYCGCAFSKKNTEEAREAANARN